MAHLLTIRGEHKGVKFPLSDGLSLGKKPSNDIRITDRGVSSFHARIKQVDGKFVLIDQQSTNGTMVNNEPVTEHTLNDGDVISMGKAGFRFMEHGQTGLYETSGMEAAGGETAQPPKPSASAAESVKEERPKNRPAEKPRADNVDPDHLKEATKKLLKEVGKVIVGQKHVLYELMVSLFSGGHGLMVGVPGVAKTLMVRTISQALELEFNRIQFTPDLMPSDITGTDILEEDEVTKQREFKFVKGPVFTNVLLADEINRTPPKTQAALLEAMQEHRVTASGVTYELSPPFFVLATQNPLEQEGTYPLPEAQLDRFMFFIHVDYPKGSEEIEILRSTTGTVEAIVQPVMTRAQVIGCQKLVRSLPVSDHVLEYVSNIVRSTRPNDELAPDFVKKWVNWGAGPRAGQYLVIAAKARAAMDGRAAPSCEDVKRFALPVLRHRVFLNYSAVTEGQDTDSVIKKILENVKPPEASEKT